jgi:hypothetical protein
MATVNTINDLPALGRTPTSGDKLALQPQGDNTKSIDYDALATAIINKLGGNPVTVEHGGFGGTTVEQARTNLEVPASVYISGTTWADVFTELSKVRTNTAATLLTSANSASLLTGSAVSNVTLKGVVRRSGSTYDFFVLADVSTIYSWRISGLSSASATPTVGEVYEYQSTANFVKGQVAVPASAKTTYTITMRNNGRSMFFGMTGGGDVMLVAAACGASGVITLNVIFKTSSITLTNTTNTITVTLPTARSMWIYEVPMTGSMSTIS